MIVRTFNSAGLDRVNSFLDSLTGPTPSELPFGLLADPAMSEEVAPLVEVDRLPFKTRYDFAAYLCERLAPLGRVRDKDAGMWTWLAMFYFNDLCKKDRAGRWRPGERSKWVPRLEDYLRYYRHLVAGPVRIYREYIEHPEAVRPILWNPLDTPGDLYEQIASRQEVITNKPFMAAMATLFFSQSEMKLRRGAASSARRLAGDVLAQFDLTYDLYGMSGAAIVELLPDEFERFRTLAAAE